MLPEDKENMDQVGAYKKPMSSNRSVLSKVQNQENSPGVAKQDVCARNGENNVSWADMVQRNL